MLTVEKFKVFAVIKQYVLKQSKDYGEVFECVSLFFIILINLFIYLFLAALGLRCCA